MLRAIAFSAALALGVASSPGVRAQECERPALILAVLKTQIPDMVWKLYSGREAEKVVAVWNAAPPASDDKAEDVILMISQFVPDFVGVLLISGGCVVGKGSLPVADIVGLKLSSARGA